MHFATTFEAANPHSPDDAVMLSPGKAIIRPWSEDGDGNYKFLLDVGLTNDADNDQPLDLAIDWRDTEYMSVRGYVMIGRGDDWQAVPGQVSGSVTTVRLTVPPGEWRLSLQPTYDPERFQADRAKAVAGGLSERVVGSSFYGREIVALAAGPADAPAIFVTSRFHPYETAGSFCASAILELLAEDLAAGGPLTRRFRFVIVPMPNPDGVALGCPKRCRQGGADICHESGQPPDPAWQAVADLLEATDPRGYLDIHGWMHTDGDGLCFSDPTACSRWCAIMSGEPALGKKWKFSYRDWALRPGDFYSRAQKLCDAVTFLPSITWFDRTPEQMRRIGRACLTALCEVVGKR